MLKTTHIVKKIIIATPSITTGGMGSYLMNLAEGLKLYGWTVHLLTTNSRGDLFDDVRESAICHDLSGTSLSWKKVTAAADLVNEISPDILLLNHVSLIHYTLPLLSPGIKPIVVLHSDDPRFYKTAVLFSRRIFHWVAPATKLAKQCESYLPEPLRTRVRTIPHGVRTNVFYKNRGNGGLAGRKIVFTGYLAKNKGADLLPDIVRCVLDDFPDTGITLIGDGPLRLHLEQKFKEQGVIDRCEFEGPVSQNDVAGRLRESDIFLLPTRIEGFGLTIVEAMLSGAVPVVSRLRGITDDIVDDGITGMLVEPDDMNGFAEAIVHLLKNPERLRSMSDAAITTATERYSATGMIDAYESLFLEADDREYVTHLGVLGWMRETIGEVMKQGVDRKWLVNRIMENWK